jgi:ribosomal protein S18 acetylase RimI-like enzyme
MLGIAADWRAGTTPRSSNEVMADPALAHYITDWPRDDDFGVVAVEREHKLGAAWWRFLSASERGYGFVAGTIPEVSIGVVASARGRGIGRALMLALTAEADRRTLPGLSLSVEVDNFALGLYRSLGFVLIRTTGNAVTMLRFPDRRMANMV